MVTKANRAEREHMEFVERWIAAHSDHLRNDPVSRRLSDVIFEGKGYPPRDRHDVRIPRKERA
jgi:hypothetical protein